MLHTFCNVKNVCVIFRMQLASDVQNEKERGSKRRIELESERGRERKKGKDRAHQQHITLGK